MYRHHRHESTCVSTPPSSSPSAPAPPATAPKIPNARDQSAVPANVTVNSDSAAGASSARHDPPGDARGGDEAYRRTARTHRRPTPPRTPTNPTINAHLRPNRSPTLPPTSSRLPNASAYAVTTHCRFSFEKCNARCADGGADRLPRSSRPAPPSAAQRSAGGAPPSGPVHDGFERHGGLDFRLATWVHPPTPSGEASTAHDPVRFVSRPDLVPRRTRPSARRWSGERPSGRFSQRQNGESDSAEFRRRRRGRRRRHARCRAGVRRWGI